MAEQRWKKAVVWSCAKDRNDSVIYQLCLKIDDDQELKIAPGQFVALHPLNGAVMKRPFSVAKIIGQIIYLFIKAVGKDSSNSRMYARLEPGTEIGLSGPHGKGFELLPGIENYILAGGGMGGAGLFLLAEKIIQAEKKIEFIEGFKTAREIFGHDILMEARLGPDAKLWPDRNFQTAIEDHPTEPALATDLLEKSLAKNIPSTAVIACGPRLMLKKVFELCSARQIPCYVSVEELMACANGSCMGCAIEMKDGTFPLVCKDGPIFDAYLINWEKFIPRPAVIIKQKGGQPRNPLKIILQKKDRRNLILDYPWAAAPGCLGLDEAKNNPDLKVGFYHLKGVSLEPWPGNPAPRICEAGSGLMLNSIGLPNNGVDHFIEEDLLEWGRLNKPVIVQLAGKKAKEYSLAAEKFVNLPVTAIDLNLSCPNLERGGLSFGTDPKIVYEIVSSVRSILPFVHLTVKLTPNVTDVAAIAFAAAKGGADSLSLINTLIGMRIDINTRRMKLARGNGGLSGRGIISVGIAAVNRVYKADLGVPIIGVGGISSGEEALEYFLAGANIVEVGTAFFANRNIFDEIDAAIDEYLGKNNIAYLQDLVGAAELP
ncbi:MAG: dihydroorotate dehydrogenase [Patescibacteria group bacterium]|nr:dihydroorotate dehydrogenase [Patescibacteria group bacterium]